MVSATGYENPRVNAKLPLMYHVAPEIRTSIVSLFVALAVASSLALAASWRYPDANLAELRNRIRTWWVIAGLFTFTLAWSHTSALIFFAFVSYLALKEFFSMTPTRRADRRVLFYAYLAVPIQFYLAASARYGMFMVFIPVLMFIWLPTRMWLIGKTEGFLRAAGTLHWGLMVTVFSLSHAALLLVFAPADSARVPPAHSSPMAAADPGTGLVFFLVLMTELNDIFQRLWGKLLPRQTSRPDRQPRKDLHWLDRCRDHHGCIFSHHWAGQYFT